MRTLSNSMDGSDVQAWQKFLSGQGLLAPGNVIGHFGPLTDEATRKFQQQHELVAEGVVGPKTVAAAMQLVFTEPSHPAVAGALAEVHPELARRAAALIAI